MEAKLSVSGNLLSLPQRVGRVGLFFFFRSAVHPVLGDGLLWSSYLRRGQVFPSRSENILLKHFLGGGGGGDHLGFFGTSCLGILDLLPSLHLGLLRGWDRNMTRSWVQPCFPLSNWGPSCVYPRSQMPTFTGFIWCAVVGGSNSLFWESWATSPNSPTPTSWGWKMTLEGTWVTSWSIQPDQGPMMGSSQGHKRGMWHSGF